MSRKCSVCDKGPVAGRTYTYRGIAISKGGIGLNITGKTKRRFLPNLKKIRIKTAKGGVISARVCTRCIKSGKIQKAI
jgi:large subunit ribosomal protein L28